MNSRRAFVKQGALAAAAIVAINPIRSFAGFSPSVYGGQFSNDHSLTVLHTSDLGDQFSSIMDGSPYQGLGGFRSVKQAIRAVRNEWKNVVLVDAGNMKEPLFQHASELKYDGICLSAAGSDISNATQEHQLPVISHHPSGLRSAAVPFRILQKGNIRVGIISANIEGSTSNPVLHAVKTASHLKKEEGCQLVICLSNLGLDSSKRLNEFTLASLSTDIDMIVGSGTGTVLRAPQTCFNKNRQEVIINHSGYGGLVVGKIDFQFDEKGNKCSVRFNNLVIGTPGHRWKGLPSVEKKILA